MHVYTYTAASDSLTIAPPPPGASRLDRVNFLKLVRQIRQVHFLKHKLMGVSTALFGVFC